MSEPELLNVTELLARDPGFHAWMRRFRRTPSAWRTCCHEAGHVVAALRVLQVPYAVAMIFDAREGVTMMPPSSGLRHAVTVAAGNAAAALADMRSPPMEQAVFYENEKEWKSVASSPNDATLLRSSLKATHVCAPSRKAVRRLAAQFVREHAEQIFYTASYLFLHGSGEFALPKK